MRDKLLFKSRLHKKAQHLANGIVVATPDLLSQVEGAAFIPNPVDTEHFFPDRSENRLVSDKEALTMDTEATDCNLAMQQCRQNNIRLSIDVYDRMKGPIMYKDMPQFLKKYAVYVDIRYVNGQILPNLSKTALEALACGLRVLNYRLQYQEHLPVEHQPLNVLSRLQSVYTVK
jgi:hypothetical protein